jgi:hypothetical protein
MWISTFRVFLLLLVGGCVAHAYAVPPPHLSDQPWIAPIHVTSFPFHHATGTFYRPSWDSALVLFVTTKSVLQNGDELVDEVMCGPHAIKLHRGNVLFHPELDMAAIRLPLHKYVVSAAMDESVHRQNLDDLTSSDEPNDAILQSRVMGFPTLADLTQSNSMQTLHRATFRDDAGFAALSSVTLGDGRRAVAWPGSLLLQRRVVASKPGPWVWTDMVIHHTDGSASFQSMMRGLPMRGLRPLILSADEWAQQPSHTLSVSEQ